MYDWKSYNRRERESIILEQYELNKRVQCERDRKVCVLELN